MPVDKTINFGEKISKISLENQPPQPPLLEKIIQQYQEIFCLQVDNHIYPATFTPEGKFLSFKGSSKYHLAAKRDGWGHSHYALLQELRAGYLGNGLISTFSADLLYDDNCQRYALLIPNYSPKTGKIIKLKWDTNGLGDSTTAVSALEKSRIIYRTPSEVLADLVGEEK